MGTRLLMVVVLRNRMTGVETRGTAYANSWIGACAQVTADTGCQDPMWIVIDPKASKANRVIKRAKDWHPSNPSKHHAGQAQLPF